MIPDDKRRDISISVAPPIALEVEYFAPIVRTIIVTNNSDKNILIEDETLRFHSDVVEEPPSITINCASILTPGAVFELPVQIIPTAIFSEGTNEFDVRVAYRIASEGQMGTPRQEISFRPSFIIPRFPTTYLGKVFISLKQPEDLHLGRLMLKLARRAGFFPFLKDDNRRLSEDIWKDTIEPALRNSNICIVIWTNNTAHWRASGVEQEISFCRKNDPKIPEALFLEQNAVVPQLYEGTTIEYSRFDRDDAGKIFAAGIDALRHRLQAENYGQG